jgi:hypothetical protein
MARLVRQPSGCLIWTGPVDRKGYGRVTRVALSASPILVHRLAHYYATGAWPPVVMHSCDTPACCEPAHLVAGTVATNNADMRAKGRAVRPPVARRCQRHPDADRAPNGARLLANGEPITQCRECKRERQRRH